MSRLNALFQSSHRVGSVFSPPELPGDAVKHEPMLFNCDLAFARDAATRAGAAFGKRRGAITLAFIDTFLREHPDVDPNACVIDTRVHMLMPGFWPCIPGWHHDDVPRGPDGQPNYLTPAYRAKHCLGLVNGHLAPTEFAGGFATMSDPREHRVVYQAWDAEVESQISSGRLAVWSAPSGRLIDFDCDSFHRGTKATDAGWRWFGRISWDTGRKATNEIRQQVQVYMDDPRCGW